MRRISVAVVMIAASSGSALADRVEWPVPNAQFAEAAAALPLTGFRFTDGAIPRQPTFKGSNTPKSAMRTTPLERPSGNIVLRAENLGEEVSVNIYKADGSFNEAAMARLDELFRCPRSGDVRAVRAELYEHLSRVYDHFGKTVLLFSGYRLNGEGASSRHFHASAMDIKVRDVPYRDVYDFAATLDTGSMGLGIYPNTGFVHIDYRAPGEPSFRWTDYSGGRSAPKKPKKSPPPRTTPAKKPTS
ncbi:MAG: DUF882 domain-containing protein [Deltaproteobacteria bacterium]|nr:DUF882 domain-containing protein [Deltaproteobacteria bacterium]